MSSIPMPPERDEDAAYDERRQRELDAEMEAKRRASGYSPEQLLDAGMSVGEALSELIYISYATNRDRRPDITTARWAAIYHNAEALEAKYQAEKAIIRARHG